MVETRTFISANEPHLPTLAAALNPVAPLASPLRFDKGQLFITADFSGTTNQAVQAIVDAAPVASQGLDAKLRIDTIELYLKAAFMVALDLINVERGRHGAAAITKAQFIQAVKDRVDTA